MSITLPASLPTWPASWSAPTNCQLTYSQFLSQAGNDFQTAGAALWQDLFVPPFDPKTLSCYPPPGPTGLKFQYSAAAPMDCPRGWTRVGSTSTAVWRVGDPGQDGVMWECCSTGWTYTALGSQSTGLCQSFVPTPTGVIAHETEVSLPFEDLNDDTPVSHSYTYITTVSSITATAYPITAVYYPTDSPIITPLPSSKTLTTAAKAGIGAGVSIAAIAIISALVMLIFTLRRRKHSRRLRKYSDIRSPTALAVAGSMLQVSVPADLNHKASVLSTAATAGYGGRDEPPAVEVPRPDTFLSPWPESHDIEEVAELPDAPVPPPPPVSPESPVSPLTPAVAYFPPVIWDPGAESERLITDSGGISPVSPAFRPIVASQLRNTMHCAGSGTSAFTPAPNAEIRTGRDLPPAPSSAHMASQGLHGLPPVPSVRGGRTFYARRLEEDVKQRRDKMAR